MTITEPACLRNGSACWSGGTDYPSICEYLPTHYPSIVLLTMWSLSSKHPATSIHACSDICNSCLYHTANILVHRSMIDEQSVVLDNVSSAEALSTCLYSGSNICVILNLFFKSFGDGHCTMALAYSIYTAALIFLQRLDNNQPMEAAGQRGLEYCLTVLGDISTVHPGKLSSSHGPSVYKCTC